MRTSISPNYDWIPWGGFGGNLMYIHVDETVHFRQKYESMRLWRVWWDFDLPSCVVVIPYTTNCCCMPWGGFGKIRICIHVEESHTLQKLRLDAVGLVGWDLEFPSRG